MHVYPHTEEAKYKMRMAKLGKKKDNPYGDWMIRETVSEVLYCKKHNRSYLKPCKYCHFCRRDKGLPVLTIINARTKVFIDRSK